MNEWYGPEKVVILSIDGPENPELAQLFNVNGYPHFHSVLPNTQGKPYTMFNYNPRNYFTLKKWMLEIMGDTPL